MEAIIYNSNTGSTKKYALLLSDAVGIPALSLKEAKKSLKKGAEILYLGWVMASGVRGYHAVAERYRLVAVAAVGMAATGTGVETIREKNAIPRELPLFTLQGNFSPEKLSPPKRLLMRLLENSLRKKVDRTPGEEETLRLMSVREERVREENLGALLAWYRAGQA